MKLYIRDKRVSDLVVDAIMDQCKKEISFKSSLTVRGMFIVTVDSKQASVVNMNKKVIKKLNRTSTAIKRKLPQGSAVPAKIPNTNESNTTVQIQNPTTGETQTIQVIPDGLNMQGGDNLNQIKVIPSHDFQNNATYQVISQSAPATVSTASDVFFEEVDEHSSVDHVYACTVVGDNAGYATVNTAANAAKGGKKERKWKEIITAEGLPQYPDQDEYLGKTPLRELYARMRQNSKTSHYSEKQMWDACRYVIIEDKPTRWAAFKYNFPRTTLIKIIERVMEATDDPESVLRDINGPPLTFKTERKVLPVHRDKELDRILDLRRTDRQLWDACRKCIRDKLPLKLAAIHFGVKHCALTKYVKKMQENAEFFDEQFLDLLYQEEPNHNFSNVGSFAESYNNSPMVPVSNNTTLSVAQNVIPDQIEIQIIPIEGSDGAHSYTVT